MAIQYHPNIVQGSEEWKALRCGILTASKIPKLITPTLKLANNDDSRAIVYELMCERITGIVQDEFQSFDMMRGHEEEVYARMEYSKNYTPVQEMGFVTNDRLGFVLGWSPDGLVGDDGAIECKSRKNHLQIKTIMGGVIPSENIIQVQAELFISERKWIDYVSYSNGMPMWTIRAYPDREIQDAIHAAVTGFEKTCAEYIGKYSEILTVQADKFIQTERRDYSEEITAS